jgi:excisionase family DNA binding protein
MNVDLRAALVQLVPRLSLTREEAADAFGISVGTFDMWTREHGVPHVRRGRVLLFPISGLQQWLAENSEVASQTETDRF